MGRRDALHRYAALALVLAAIAHAGCLGRGPVDGERALRDRAWAASDPELCDGISDVTARDECYVASAPRLGDARPCERSTSPAARDRCLAAVAASRSDIFLCARVRSQGGDDALRTSCYRDASASLRDPELCRWIEPAGVRNECLARFEATRTDGVCRALGAREGRDACLVALARSTGSAAHCGGVEGDGARALCIEAANATGRGAGG